jgi:hypothetical protein
MKYDASAIGVIDDPVAVVRQSAWSTGVSARAFAARRSGPMTTHGLQIAGATFPVVWSKFYGHLVGPTCHARQYGNVPLRLVWCLSLNFTNGLLTHDDELEVEPHIRDA